jgi:hypothetical protein
MGSHYTLRSRAGKHREGSVSARFIVFFWEDDRLRFIGAEEQIEQPFPTLATLPPQSRQREWQPEHS